MNFKVSPYQYHAMDNRKRMAAALSGLAGYSDAVQTTRLGANVAPLIPTSRAAALIASTMNGPVVGSGLTEHVTRMASSGDAIDFRTGSLTNLPKFTNRPNSNISRTRPNYVQLAGLGSFGRAAYDANADGKDSGQDAGEAQAEKTIRIANANRAAVANNAVKNAKLEVLAAAAAVSKTAGKNSTPAQRTAAARAAAALEAAKNKQARAESNASTVAGRNDAAVNTDTPENTKTARDAAQRTAEAKVARAIAAAQAAKNAKEEEATFDVRGGYVPGTKGPAVTPPGTDSKNPEPGVLTKDEQLALQRQYDAQVALDKAAKDLQVAKEAQAAKDALNARSSGQGSNADTQSGDPSDDQPKNQFIDGRGYDPIQTDTGTKVTTANGYSPVGMSMNMKLGLGLGAAAVLGWYLTKKRG